MLLLALLALVSSAIPCALFCLNLFAYRVPSPGGTKPTSEMPAVSVLIPARNEAHGIEEAIRAVLASEGVGFEVVVMDDQSEDRTAAIVEALTLEDRRVRLLRAPPLPHGWNGKQHTCWHLAQAARNPILCFVDADVRLEPECLARMAGFLAEGGNGLVSGFPRQVTGTSLEWLLLPLIHFVLLGFLPLGRMRAGTHPGFAAGCGQFLMADRAAYFATGGHTGIKLTMHDGLRLPRLFREHGYRTDLADITPLARCRMYTGAAQVWSGLAKNATEGLAAPERILPISLLLVVGQVVPFAVFGLLLLRVAATALTSEGRAWLSILLHGDVLIEHPASVATMLVSFVLAAFFAWLPRVLAAIRFRQDWRSALLHPVGIVTLLVLQWYALIRQWRGGAVRWKNRAYAGD